MGTSSAYGGPGNGTPLIPSWLNSDGGAAGSSSANGDGASPAPSPSSPSPSPSPSPTPPPPSQPAIPTPAAPNRYTQARTNFTRFANSGGSDRASFGRAVSNYVGGSSGGAQTAARRMGSSRTSGARLVGFLSDVRERGATEALRSLDLEKLAGRPIDEVFLGLADYICPNVGTVDEGIARDAFVETIVDIASLGVTDLDTLSEEQMQTVFELYATHTIEARLCNDIGLKLINAPSDAHVALRVQAQIRDFIRNAVSDALTTARAQSPALHRDRVHSFVDEVYLRAFEILKSLGDSWANQ